MNTLCISTLLLFVLIFNIGHSLPISSDTNSSDNSPIICIVQNELKTTPISECTFANEQFICPSVVDCIYQLSNLSITTPANYEIQIEAGMYSKCAGSVLSTDINLSGNLLFTSINGIANFSCQFQFLSIEFLNPINIQFDNIAIASGLSYTNGGCFSISTKATTDSVVNITNSVINGCYSVFDGAVIDTNFLNVYIYNSSFTNNLAQVGRSGVVSAVDATVTIKDSTFNVNGNYGGFNGGVCTSRASYIYNSHFNYNFGGNGGAIYSQDYMYIQNSTFTENNAMEDGGAVATTSGSITVIDSVFFSNEAINGGAISGTNISISGSSFYGNQAQTTGYGGAIIAAVEQTNTKANSLSIVNSYFNGNSAFENGGAIFIDTVSLNIVNSTLEGNSAQRNGGAISIVNGFTKQTINILNSTLNSNLSKVNGGALYLFKSKDYKINVNLLQSTFSYNIASRYGGGFFFTDYPDTFIGGNFIYSKSSEFGSMTFYSQSYINANVANITATLPYYYVPIFDEQSNEYVKALQVNEVCEDGVATIDINGNVLSCECFAPAHGKNCFY